MEKSCESSCAGENMSKAETCAFSLILNEPCGPKRGDKHVIFLHERIQDSNNFGRCNLSREPDVTEVNLTLAQAGFFDIGASKIKPLNIALFISELTAISVSHSTGISPIESVVYGIKWGHNLAGIVECPTSHPLVKSSLEGARRKLARPSSSCSNQRAFTC